MNCKMQIAYLKFAFCNLQFSHHKPGAISNWQSDEESAGRCQIIQAGRFRTI
jgi:hypothetical protein